MSFRGNILCRVAKIATHRKAAPVLLRTLLLLKLILKLNLNRILIGILTLAISAGCMGYAYQEVRIQDNPEALVLPSECLFQPDFTGWSYFPSDRKQMEELLAAYLSESRPEAPVLEIRLEQTDITPAWRKLPNVVITVLTSSVVPLVEYFEYRLVFRIMDSGEVIIERQYTVMLHTLVSVLVIPFMPFMYPPSERQEALKEAGLDFLRTSLAHCRASP